MKKFFIVSISLIYFVNIHCQVADLKSLKTLSTEYHKYSPLEEPDKRYFHAITERFDDSIKFEMEFVFECISQNTDLLDQKYIRRPNKRALLNLYAIKHFNRFLDEPEKGKELNDLFRINDLNQISTYELLDNYYKMLFHGAFKHNKQYPFDLTNINFDLNELNLRDDTEQAIFFLRCMRICYSFIYGSMHMLRAPNTTEAMKIITKFPKFNNSPYYLYTNFDFNDFNFFLHEGDKSSSYKRHKLNKYYDLLLDHLFCLNKKCHNQISDECDVIDKLKEESILNKQKYYKYSQKREILERSFIRE